ncbi:MAG: peptidylprolyl isomerase [Chloracidobacterium sp.]|nr:peptidylprolyl isomerase [Chloracidobacterium sp.]
MTRKLTIFFFAAAVLAAGCGVGSPARNTRTGLLTGVAPVADAEVAVIEMEDAPKYGTITLELYSNVAPRMVAQFKALAKEGVYNGTTFHRINPSVIQGGDPLSKDENPSNDGTGRSNKPNVPAEFTDIPYDTGILGAARGSDINSANSQFFITLQREPGFDKNYTIFGKVIDGMENVKAIAAVTPKVGERPVDPVRIKTITIKPKG